MPKGVCILARWGATHPPPGLLAARSQHVNGLVHVGLMKKESLRDAMITRCRARSGWAAKNWGMVQIRTGNANWPYYDQMSLRRPIWSFLGVIVLAVATDARGANANVRFLCFDKVREVIARFADLGLISGEVPQRSSWKRWIGARDCEIRSRIDWGIEDSISNLILYGCTFTSLRRIDDAEQATTPAGSLTEAARAQVLAFVSALANQHDNERVRFAATLLARQKVVGVAKALAIQEVLSLHAHPGNEPT